MTWVSEDARSRDARPANDHRGEARGGVGVGAS